MLAELQATTASLATKQAANTQAELNTEQAVLSGSEPQAAKKGKGKGRGQKKTGFAAAQELASTAPDTSEF